MADDVDDRPRRVLVVDDHPMFREGVRDLLSTVGYQVIAASTGEEAVALAKSTLPDLVVMAMEMPDISGIEATRQMLAASPDIPVLILSAHADPVMVLMALRAGARSYAAKQISGADLLDIARLTMNGQAAFAPAELASALVHRVTRATGGLDSLTEREREIALLAARGLTTQAIADSLFLSSKTVANHLSNMYAKLGITNRSELTRMAIEAGHRVG